MAHPSRNFEYRRHDRIAGVERIADRQENGTPLVDGLSNNQSQASAAPRGKTFKNDRIMLIVFGLEGVNGGSIFHFNPTSARTED
jgi:hypothetical protein